MMSGTEPATSKPMYMNGYGGVFATVNYGTMNECVNKGQVSLLFNNIEASNYANVGGVVGYSEEDNKNHKNAEIVVSQEVFDIELK